MGERKMKRGALLVRTRAIVGYDALKVREQYHHPDPPKIAVHSVAGHDELKDAPTDSPEWAEYARQVHEIDERQKEAGQDFLYDYAVESWSWDGGKTWLVDEPADWEFPAVLLRHGIKPTDNRRVDYIRHSLVTHNEDVAALFADALSDSAPITDAEVDAASAGFPSDDARRRIAGSGSKWYQRFKWPLQRHGGGAGMGANA